MNLPKGTRFALEVEQDENGYVLTPRLRVGNSGVRALGNAKRLRSWDEVLMAVEDWAQDSLARSGLEQTKGR